MCIVRELAVHAAMDEVTADAMGVAVNDGVSILIISFSATILLVGSFGFRHCGIYTIFLMLNFFAVYFSISSSTLALRSLYYKALFTGCSCTTRMLAISCFCSANALLSCRIELSASFLSYTDTVVWCLVLVSSLVKKSFKLLLLFCACGLVLTGITCQVEQSSVFDGKVCRAKYIFFLVNGSSPALENILQSSLQFNSTAMGVVGSHCAYNAI